jgi:hypothetical protein
VKSSFLKYSTLSGKQKTWPESEKRKKEGQEEVNQDISTENIFLLLGLMPAFQTNTKDIDYGDERALFLTLYNIEIY